MDSTSAKSGAQPSSTSYANGEYRRQNTARSSSSPLAPYSPSLSLQTPSRASKTTHARFKQEITASDDEGSSGSDSSDDSLDDVQTLWQKMDAKNVPMAQRGAPASRKGNPLTPTAKRIVLEIRSSPITPRHKFNMKALLRDARQDAATEDSSLRARTMGESESNTGSPSTDADLDAPISDTLKDVLQGEGSGQAQKVLRVVRRAEAGVQKPLYCFFNPVYQVPRQAKAPSNLEPAHWRMFVAGNDQNREANFVSGVPRTIAQKCGGVPDQLFDWICDEMCTQGSAALRAEYLSIVGLCRNQVSRLLTPERINDLFLRLGAAKDLTKDGSELTLSYLAEDPYPDRDWSCLRSFIKLLGSIAPQLSDSGRRYACMMMLRMSLDRIIMDSIDLLTDFEASIAALLAAVPHRNWDDFCYSVCSELHSAVKSQAVRSNAVTCLPTYHDQAHDLRQRLAMTFLFEDSELSRRPPNETMTMKLLSDCLHSERFSVNRETNYTELISLVIFLDCAIGDGAFTSVEDSEADKIFNEQVDEMATRLRSIWRDIDDSGMKLARTEAKSAIEWVQQRLSYSVRTRRKARRSIFDMAKPGKTETSTPLQRDYMKKFLSRHSSTPSKLPG